jgi:hypothetical protein
LDFEIQPALLQQGQHRRRHILTNTLRPPAWPPHDFAHHPLQQIKSGSNLIETQIVINQRA